MSKSDAKPEKSRLKIFDTPLFVGALGVMAVAVGVMIFHGGSPGEPAVGMANVFVGLIVAGAGVIMKMRSGPRLASGTPDARTALQPLLTTAFVLGVFAVLAVLAMDRLLDGQVDMRERLMVNSAAAFAWMLPIQVLKWDRIADEAVNRAWLSAFLPGYFVLMAGATTALMATFWRSAFTAPILILSLAASAMIVAGEFWLDRKSGARAE